MYLRVCTSCIKKIAISEPLVDTVNPDQIITKVCTLKTIDIHTCKKEDLCFEAPWKMVFIDSQRVARELLRRPRMLPAANVPCAQHLLANPGGSRHPPQAWAPRGAPWLCGSAPLV